MAKRKFLKPAHVLAAAVASMTATAGASSSDNLDHTNEQDRLNKLYEAVQQGAEVGTADLILQRPMAEPSGALAQHYSHRSHSSHQSHRSHASHQSHSSHFSSSW